MFYMRSRTRERPLSTLPHMRKVSRMRKEIALRQRFLQKVRKTRGCWMWMAGTNGRGYGCIYGGGESGGRQLRAHRVAFTLFIGPIPEDKYVLHSCDNPACVNPSHLFLGTQPDNIQDRDAKGRQAQGERQGLSKLTQQQVREIRNLYRSGSHEFGLRGLGRRYDVFHTTILRIVRGDAWRS